MSDYDKDVSQDWTPEQEEDWNKTWEETPLPSSLDELLVEQDKTCNICHSILNDDGTAENCAGECDRGLPPDLHYDEELNFD